jgi:hypothetical protein
MQSTYRSVTGVILGRALLAIGRILLIHLLPKVGSDR